jgi:hypothetical protein
MKPPHSGYDYFGEAKEKYTIPDIWKIFGLEGEPKKSCKSPFREDRRPSFSIYADGRRWVDHSTGDGGDVIEFIKHALKGDHHDVREWLADRILQNPSFVARPSSSPLKVPQPPKVIIWPAAMGRGLTPSWEAFSERTGVVKEIGENLLQQELLEFCQVDAHACYLIKDAENRAAEIRRLDGGLFGTCKAFPLTGVDKGWLPGTARLRDASPETAVLITEGATDHLTALDLYYRYHDAGGANVWQPITLLGAGCKRLDPAAERLLRGRRVRLIPDGDEAGRGMATHWEERLRKIGCHVDTVTLPEGSDLTDNRHLDPNELFALSNTASNPPSNTP